MKTTSYDDPIWRVFIILIFAILSYLLIAISIKKCKSTARYRLFQVLYNRKWVFFDILFFESCFCFFFPRRHDAVSGAVQYFHGDDGALLHSTATLGAAAFTLSLYPRRGSKIQFSSGIIRIRRKRIIIHKGRGGRYI